MLYSIGLYFHHQSHPQLGVVFALAVSLNSSWSYFSIVLQQHIGHLPTWRVHLSVSYLFAFSYYYGVLKARILKWFAIASPVDHILSELSTMTCLSWVALHGMAHSFIELDKAVVHVIRLASCL